ncbi:DUF1610 domain-containing protein [Candidatus Woesearchaeota archaeon]|nr:DUF1610 domain-containing protein [Candidatus Woesearchaeota archaeon]
MELCSTCKVRITNSIGSVKFKCPNCGEAEIIRCSHCRAIGANYECPKCGFKGLG